jgi:hypothetical protein
LKEITMANLNRSLLVALIGSASFAGLLAGCVSSNDNPSSTSSISTSASSARTSQSGLDIAATPKGSCGPGARQETGMQGRVSQADHDSGKAALGFTCNTELVGSYITKNAIGTVGGFKVERYRDKAGHDCAYYDSTLLYPSNIADREQGVNVLDMSNPSQPVKTASLVSPAMLSPHESLVLSQEAGILAAVLGNPATGPGVVDVYDISQDCRQPVLKSSTPLGVFGHESGLSSDGKTFYSASPTASTIVAIDISNPSLPKPLWSGRYASHGLTLSKDGNRAYVADTGTPGGVLILDVSEIQARKSNPQVKVVSSVTWDTVTIPQNAIPLTINGKPYLMEVDEYSATESGGLSAHGAIVGAARMIDISDEKKPVVISNLRLDVHNRKNRATIASDPGAQNPTGGYAAHYCNVPTRVNPTIVACSMILSGLRIFDIRDPANPIEVAYYNAPVQPRILTQPAPASNWAMSSPAFVPERKEIWYTDGYSGFYVVKVTNDAWK